MTIVIPTWLLWTAGAVGICAAAAIILWILWFAFIGAVIFKACFRKTRSWYF